MAEYVAGKEAIRKVKNGMTVMIGGFLEAGSPEYLIDLVLDQKLKNLSLVVNDIASLGKGAGKLVNAGSIKKIITSYLGADPNMQKLISAKKLEVILVPQGTLAERIRAGGLGLGGILTYTGIGTLVEEKKTIVTIEGQQYILERPLKADVALIKAHTADRAGNLVYRKSARNFNPLMAMSAAIVIAEAENILQEEMIDPEHVITPGIFIDYIVNNKNL